MKQQLQQICEGINWVDVTDPSPDEMQEISKEYNLNAHLVRDCLEPDHLPKYDYVDDVHFLILRFYAHALDKRMGSIQELTNKVAVFYKENFLITIHRNEAPFLEIIRKKYVETNRCSSIMQVITRIVWNTLETFDDPANLLSEHLDFYENQVMMRKINNEDGSFIPY
jgi:magnesium transporter